MGCHVVSLAFCGETELFLFKVNISLGHSPSRTTYKEFCESHITNFSIQKVAMRDAK